MEMIPEISRNDIKTCNKNRGQPHAIRLTPVESIAQEIIAHMTTYLLRHAEMLDAEFGQWDDDSETRRVMSALVEIENLKFQLGKAHTPDECADLERQLVTLQASIEDFGF